MSQKTGVHSRVLCLTCVGFQTARNLEKKEEEGKMGPTYCLSVRVFFLLVLLLRRLLFFLSPFPVGV